MTEDTFFGSCDKLVIGLLHSAHSAVCKHWETGKTSTKNILAVVKQPLKQKTKPW